MKFIDKIAHFIHENKYDLENLHIILPSERAKKYLSAALYKAYGKPIFAPKMFTMDKWIFSLIDTPVIDKTRLLLMLYKIYSEKANQETNFSFDEFMTWASMLLSDFDEIDRYIIDAQDLFKNLRDVKEIENWSFNSTELTKGQIDFMILWDSLQGYYKELDKRLTEKKLSTAGKAFKKVAQEIKLVFKQNKDLKLIFAGFNAMSKSELSIVKQLHTMGRAEILIDADKYYLDNPIHEAGTFLRQLKKEIGITKANFETDILIEKKLEITYYECSQITGQAKIMGNILENFTAEQLSQTLVMLADETLITPTLQNLPASIEKANITLGLPLKFTPIRSWVDLVFSIQENIQRFGTRGMYYRDFIRLFNHPLTTKIIDDDENKRLSAFKQQIHQKNKIYINLKNIGEQIGPRAESLLQLLCQDWNNNYAFAISQIRSLNKIIYAWHPHEFNFEKAILIAFDGALIDLENIFSEPVPEMNVRSFKNLFQQHWSPVSIAYHGNPTDGLQIMGVLETRMLDFEYVICLGMNEGTLPPTNELQTLIPMDLRRFFGLPTPREKQGIFAHHFYRLLHGAKEMHITYHTASESVGSTEKSRYLLQLQLELEKINPNCQIETKYYSLDLENSENIGMQVEKTPEILERIDEVLAKGTSASLLNDFIKCSLDFYYKRLLDFKETNEVEEDLDNSGFGTAVHETLEDLYKSFARYDKNGNLNSPAPRAVNIDDVKAMLKDCELILRQHFIEKFDNNADSITAGKNYLSFLMALQLIKRYLESEIDFLTKSSAPLFIHSLEREYSVEIELSVFGELKKIRLTGNIDRIDEVGEKLRIIDYKTGSVKIDDVRVDGKNLEKNMIAKGVKHALQLLMYNYLFLKNENRLPDQTLIVGLLAKENAFALTIINESATMASLMEEFPSILSRILENMYDLGTPFKHNPNDYFSFCQYCK